MRIETTKQQIGPNMVIRVEAVDGAIGHFGLLHKHGRPAIARTMFFMPLYVEKPRQRGVGTELVRAASRIAIRGGMETIRGQVESQHMLKILDTLFGDEAMTFEDWDPRKKRLVKLPMSYEQAVMSLERAEVYEGDLDARELGFVCQVDLTTTRANTGQL